MFVKFTNIWLCVSECSHTPDICTEKLMARLNNDVLWKKSENNEGNGKLKQIFSIFKSGTWHLDKKQNIGKELSLK